MTERIERELIVETDAEELWEVITGSGWLADEVLLQLSPGGEAEFRSGEEVRAGLGRGRAPGPPARVLVERR